MSAGSQDEQAVRFTVAEARALRGAFNVVCEILSQPGLEMPPGIPLTRSRETLFDRLSALLNNRIRAARAAEGGFQEVLDPVEAQAVRDVASGLQTMLQDDDGRELLVRVGFLVSADQGVNREDLERLDDILNKVDPTGAREVEAEPDRASAVRRIDILREETSFVLDDPIKDLAEVEAHIKTVNLLTSQCESLLSDYGELAQIAAQVAAGREETRPDFGETAALLERVDDAAFDLADQIEHADCIDREAQLRLEDSFGLITSPSTPRGELPTQLNSFLTQLRRAALDRQGGLREALGEDAPIAVPPKGRDFPEKVARSETNEQMLARIDRNRSILEEQVESVRAAPLPINAVEAAILDALPAASNVSCNTLVASLAPLAVLMAQVVVMNQPPDQGLVNRVAGARQLVMARLQRQECLDNETLRDLRDSLVSIEDPLEADPDDVERRAFAAISDVRNVFQDPRRRGGGLVAGPPP